MSAFGNLSGSSLEHGERMRQAMVDFDRNEEYVRRALSSRNCSRAINNLSKMGVAYGAALTEARHYYPVPSPQWRSWEVTEARLVEKTMAVIRACGRK